MNTSYLLLPDLLKEISIPEKGILSHTLYNDDSLKVVLFGFAKGQELTAHTAPMPATLMFLEGEADLTLGDDKQEARTGTFVHMQPKLTHGIVARTPLLMLLYLHKSAREDKAAS
jgi:quercetin dioxygenase-like cupin family protein